MYGDGNPNGRSCGIFDNGDVNGSILGAVNLPSGGLDGIRGGKNHRRGNRDNGRTGRG